ncbi:MAG TPA: MarR family winged helix-turn-helix transcriptional regulator [Streptosporangiaceae bacterium]|jgi:MarR family transcriptional regulator for hemolysin
MSKPAGPPSRPPIGLLLNRVAKDAGRAFDDALAESGGSTPVWLILLSLKTRQVANQRELAEAVGIQGATLTHHLNAMEETGLLTRRRDPDNRRVHLVELTTDGNTLFHHLATAAQDFDRKLRTGLSEPDETTLRRLLTQLQTNATG